MPIKYKFWYAEVLANTPSCLVGRIDWRKYFDDGLSPEDAIDKALFDRMLDQHKQLLRMRMQLKSI